MDAKLGIKIKDRYELNIERLREPFRSIVLSGFTDIISLSGIENILLEIVVVI